MDKTPTDPVFSPQEVWDSIPRVIQAGILGDIAAAANFSGAPMALPDEVAATCLGFINTVRGKSVALLTDDQKRELLITVWEWCIAMAKRGRPKPKVVRVPFRPTGGAA